MKNAKKQNQARDVWNFLWPWVKKNKNIEYKRKYYGKMLADRIGCSAPSLTQWKNGQINFEPDKIERVYAILDEWIALLPSDNRYGSDLYVDEDNVWHMLNYTELSNTKDVVVCDVKCKHCGEKTPSRGKHCMHCGGQLSRRRVLE